MMRTKIKKVIKTGSKEKRGNDMRNLAITLNEIDEFI